jgi:hypothetical protein
MGITPEAIQAQVERRDRQVEGKIVSIFMCLLI